MRRHTSKGVVSLETVGEEADEGEREKSQPSNVRSRQRKRKSEDTTTTTDSKLKLVTRNKRLDNVRASL